MNIELIVRYLWFLLQARGLQTAYVRIREIGGARHTRRAKLNSKH